MLQAVEQLRPADQETLLLSAWEGLSYAQIGLVVDCMPAVVDNRVMRR
ncbi:MAG: sigma factor-like helix-turn-helix DNA-binding protein [Actinomycetota bacterium]|nr:sigma factor-like helix-turn-helix DNA-binding protein [Actinomycetota bacterium]